MYAAAFQTMCIQAYHLHCLTTIGPPADTQMGKQLRKNVRSGAAQHLWAVWKQWNGMVEWNNGYSAATIDMTFLPMRIEQVLSPRVHNN